MPIDYSRYPKGWHKFSVWVRKERARWRCEWCQAVNGKPHPITGSTVVITVAHLDHDRTHMDPKRVAALCQLCHNTLDAPVRAHRRRYGAEYDGEHQTCLDLSEGRH